MSQDINKEIFAAIAYALHEELGKYNHDLESYMVTIKRQPTAWSHKLQAMRQLPSR